MPGWASTVVIVSLFNAMTMLSLTVFGVYLARISQQLTRSRRPYVLRDLHEKVDSAGSRRVSLQASLQRGAILAKSR